MDHLFYLKYFVPCFLIDRNFFLNPIYYNRPVVLKVPYRPKLIYELSVTQCKPYLKLYIKHRSNILTIADPSKAESHKDLTHIELDFDRVYFF